MATKKTEQEKLGVGLKTDELRALLEEKIKTVSQNFIFIFGGRGIGKTYTGQKAVTELVLPDNREMMAFFPTQKIIDKGTFKSWYSKMLNTEFKGWEKRYTFDAIYLRRHKDDDWLRLGIARSITAAQEGKLDTQPLVDWFVWDESLNDCSVEVRQKLITNLMKFYETVDRGEDRVKVLLLGNPERPDDPLFKFFGWTGKELQKSNEGAFKVEENKWSWYIPEPPDLKQKNGKKDRFHSMLEGTEYGDYSAGVFKQAYLGLIGLPEEGSVYSRSFCIELEIGKYAGVFSCNGIYYVESVNADEAKEYDHLFTILINHVSIDMPYLPLELSDTLYGRLMRGRLKFCDIDSYVELSATMKRAFKLPLE